MFKLSHDQLAYLAEFVAFLVMLTILARWIYPPLMRAAEARQKQIADQLAAAEGVRKDAEHYLAQAQAQAQEARAAGQRIIEAANRSSERLRHEAQETAQDDTRRIVEQAKKEIDAERQRAIQAIRRETADLVVGATQRVLVETVDDELHRKLIAKAIAQVTDRPTLS